MDGDPSSLKKASPTPAAIVMFLTYTIAGLGRAGSRLSVPRGAAGMPLRGGGAR